VRRVEFDVAAPHRYAVDVEVEHAAGYGVEHGVVAYGHADQSGQW